MAAVDVTCGVPTTARGGVDVGDTLVGVETTVLLANVGVAWSDGVHAANINTRVHETTTTGTTGRREWNIRKPGFGRHHNDRFHHATWRTIPT